MAGNLLTLTGAERRLALRIRDMLEDHSAHQGELIALIKGLDPITATKIAYHNDEFRARPIKPDDREIELKLYASDHSIDFISLCQTAELKPHWEELVKKQGFAGHPFFRLRPLPTIHPLNLLRGLVFCNGCYIEGTSDELKNKYLKEAAKLGSFLPKLERISRSVHHFYKQSVPTEPDALIKEAEELARLYPGPGTIVLAIVYSDIAKRLITMPNPDCKRAALAYSGFALLHFEHAKRLWSTSVSDDAIANATLAPNGRTWFFGKLREFYPRAEYSGLQDISTSLLAEKQKAKKENMLYFARASL